MNSTKRPSDTLDLSNDMHVFVTTLATWPKRIAAFHKRAEELNIKGWQLVQGVDGNIINKPNWWKPNARRWACNLVHLNALHQGMMMNLSGEPKPILILEEDAYLRDNFRELWQEAVDYFKRGSSSTLLYLGGRDHDLGCQVSPNIFQNVRVGGGYAYACSPHYARDMSGYFMNKPKGRRKMLCFAQDTKMQKRGILDGHATMRPFMVGHYGGPSIINKRKTRPPERAPKREEPIHRPK